MSVRVACSNVQGPTYFATDREMGGFPRNLAIFLFIHFINIFPIFFCILSVFQTTFIRASIINDKSITLLRPTVQQTLAVN